MRSELFATMSVGRLFGYCVLPGSVSMAVSAMYIVIDGMFVGHYMGHESLAAANMMWPLLGAVFAVAMMIGTGSAVQIAKYLGEKRNLRANRTFTVGVFTALGLGLFMCIAGFLVTKPFLRFMGADDATIQLATVYVRSYLLTGPLVCLYYDINSYLRICGLQKFSMYLGIFTSLFNLLLDYVFIVLLRQGIWSASFTTCVSLSLGAILGIWPFLLGKLDLKFALGGIPKRQFIRLLYNGLPQFFEESSWSVLMLIINSLLLKAGGTAAVAANAAVMYIGSVVMMLLNGMVGALQPALSYCYGAMLPKRVIVIEKWLLCTCGLFSLAVFILLELFGKLLIPLYAKGEDSEFITYGCLCITLLSFRYLLMWVEMALRGFLTALESPARAFVLSFANTFAFPLVLVLPMAHFYGLYGIWISPAIAAAMSAILAWYLATPRFAKLQQAAISAA